MKQKLRFLNFLLRQGRLTSLLKWRSVKIIIALFFLSAITKAQEQTPPEEFPIGATFSDTTRYNWAYYNSFDTSGMNTIFQYANTLTKSRLKDYYLVAVNGKIGDWIQYYSTCYYSRWESEENQTDSERVGIKHLDHLGNTIGDTVTWKGIKCWSTVGVDSAVNSIVYGPHYRQDNRYKNWAHGDRNDVRYFVRFNMTLDNPDSVSSEQDVCRLKVIYKYVIEPIGDFRDTIFLQKTLKVGDFPDSGKFNYFTFDSPNDYYKYPEQFWLPDEAGKTALVPDDSMWYNDSNAGLGIQFCVDWLVPNPEELGLTLYIDHAEVYDEDWSPYIQDPSIIEDRITDYLVNYPTSEWSNLKYWAGHDEPWSIDAFTPIRIVDEILQLTNASRLLSTFQPYWSYDGKINGDTLINQFVEMANPERLIVDPYVCYPEYSVIRYDELEFLRSLFQQCHTLRPGFWYMGQGFGHELDSGGWITWRRPAPSELKATSMLALAHGAKGLIYWNYDSYHYDNYTIQALITLNKQPTDLWNLIRNELAPRLKGKLGKTLMSLDYTGNYINNECSSCGIQDNPSLDYLEIDCNVSSYFWHAGFFTYKNFPDNKHFLLANLRTTVPVPTNLIVENNTDYNNVSFKDIEGGVGRVDTTIGYNSSISYTETMPAGEGRLYRVAPVIKYGGRLLYDETISSTTTLLDEMSIEDDAVLTVNSTYNVDKTITIKNNGSIVTTAGATMKFYNNLSLVVEGSVTISGTPQHKLVLDFLSPSDSNGIVIKSGGSLSISYCEIKNAGTGIFSELNADSLIVEYVDFIDCEDYSISITGRSDEANVPTMIDNCTIANSGYGISVNNTSGILIRWNEITNTDCGIRLSTVSDALIVCNNIGSSKEELQGILSLSSGGIIYGNRISGHTSAIQLGNSSPKIGVNTITDNKYHGIYVGANSNPYMKGEYIGNPALPYGLSGYNTIYENGGYEGVGDDNDGSEIYFYNSKAVLINGCNSIVDDRQVSPPLINTLLLMNGYSTGLPISLKSQHNFWGDSVYAARFGNLNVQYIPYELQPCPIPIGGGNDGEIVMMNQFGTIIDTIYSTGMEAPELSETESAYAEAEEYYLTGDLTSALQIYEDIITSSATDEEKYFAYERKYTIGKLTGQSTEFFNELSNTFSTLASNTQDTLDAKILNQLSTLSKIGEQEYETAISEFDNIVQQNPNSEEAVYAEIDALTTALLIEEPDSTMQKGRLGKYLIKSSSDYNERVDEILRRYFGSESKENQKETIPTEYNLYQNYPNPFNPTTTIKYDLSFASDVSLVIYDILGRKVKELVNTKQQAGRYEVQFDASNLASGVYIYQLIAEKYMSSRKMILLK